MEVESATSQRKTQITTKRLVEDVVYSMRTSFTDIFACNRKLTINLSVTIVYQLFQQTPLHVIHENLDSVLKETLKKSMSALKDIREQWDTGDAGKSSLNVA
jgi:hypothetical protein